MKDDDLLKEIKERFRESYDAFNQDYSDALDDLRFAQGENHWPSDLKAQRESDGRPCLVINKIPTFCDQVIGDIRQNEPAIKIKPVDSKADPKTAEILTGLIRNIEMQNEAETAYDTAVENAVYCGIGAWRIRTDYTDDDRFEQDIIIDRVKNPFSIYWDPSAQKFDRSDAYFCFVTEKIRKEVFEKMYPEASLMPFEGGKDKEYNWGDDKNIRIVEYWTKEKTKKTIYLVQNPLNKEIFATEMTPREDYLPGWQVLKDRQVESYIIKWSKATQAEILEGPITWAGKYIPIIMVYGKEIIIEGHSYFRGVVRNAKDSQRLYNFSRSTGAEIVSLAPKAPYLVTARMIQNYMNIWQESHKRSYPYLPYEPDPQNPQAIPKRAEPVLANTGIQQEIIIADQEMHDTTGLQLASLGKKSNEKSGRAILARQREGDVANFAYYDNLARALKYSGRVILDLIPKIYDTARIIRILNPDGSDQFVPVNQQFFEAGVQKIYDLTVGKYDVVVSIGPSYTTQREETAENIIAFLQAVPAAGPLVADILAKNMDWPGAEELERRLKLLLPPQVQQAASPGGGALPPAPPPPDPMMMMQFKKAEAEAQGVALDNEMKFHQIDRLKRGLPMEPKEKKEKEE